MDELTHDDFQNFIESYKKGCYVDEYRNVHRFYDTVTELSRSGDEREDPLITNSQKMYGLDWIVKASKLSKHPPKSTDALFIRQNEDGILSLHLIEFKFIGKKSHRDKMNILWRDIRMKLPCDDCDFMEDECFDEFFVKDFKLIKRQFKDPVEISLQLKPYEVVFITLPKLYEEYCNENGIPKKDIKAYLAKIDKYYWAFVGSRSQSEYSLKSRISKFNNYNRRLEMTIFKKARAKPWQRFGDVLNNEILGNFNFGEFNE